MGVKEGYEGASMTCMLSFFKKITQTHTLKFTRRKTGTRQQQLIKMILSSQQPSHFSWKTHLLQNPLRVSK